MCKIKPITQEGIPKALERAGRYRFLNEPRESESICLDVLEIAPDNQEALVTLLLALSDQFGSRSGSVSIEDAKYVLPRLDTEFAREYYAGIICERWAKIQLDEIVPGYVIYERIRQAMAHYEKAETLAPAGRDDPILRWNTCVRILERYHDLRPRQTGEPDLL
jgi:hypothetical protein